MKFLGEMPSFHIFTEFSSSSIFFIFKCYDTINLNKMLINDMTFSILMVLMNKKTLKIIQKLHADAVLERKHVDFFPLLPLLQNFH